MTKLLNLKIDLVFKMFFSLAENNGLLIEFLTATLNPPCSIVSAEIRNPTDDWDSELGIGIDIFVKMKDNSYFITELMMNGNRNFRQKKLLCWAAQHAKQQSANDYFEEIYPTVIVLITSKNQFPGNKCHSIFKLMELVNQEVFSEDLCFHTIELKKLSSDSEIAKTNLAAWVKLFSVDDFRDLDCLVMEAPIIKKAAESLRILSQDANAHERARMRENALINYHSAMTAAKASGFAEGKASAIRKHYGQIIHTLASKGQASADIAMLLDLDIASVEEIIENH